MDLMNQTNRQVGKTSMKSGITRTFSKSIIINKVSSYVLQLKGMDSIESHIHVLLWHTCDYYYSHLMKILSQRYNCVHLGSFTHHCVCFIFPSKIFGFLISFPHQNLYIRFTVVSVLYPYLHRIGLSLLPLHSS